MEPMENQNPLPDAVNSNEILPGSVFGAAESVQVMKAMENQNPLPDVVNCNEILPGSVSEALESVQDPTMEDPSPDCEITFESITKTLDFDDCESDEPENPVLDKCETSGGCSVIVVDDDRVVENVEEIKESKEVGSPVYDCDEERDVSCMEGENECSEIYDLTDADSAKSFYPLSSWSEPEPCPVGAGLSNLGNTCFMNVIMQCFTHTVPFVEGLLSLKHDASTHGLYEFCILCAIQDQIERSLAFSGKIISPTNLVDNLNHISSSFQRYHQEDAHEFLQCLFDKLDTIWTKQESNTKKPPSIPESLIKQVFGGRLVSQLRCCKCGYNSDSYEPMNDLSLEIEDVDDLESAIKSFTKVENLEDSANCDNCKEKVQREKQLSVDQAPPVAALHLKRFKSDGNYVEKIDKIVKYPLELDLDPYIKGARDDKEELKYELYGFVVHVGLSSTSGHYFCYIRTSPDSWYRFDDSKVTKVSEETALDQEAYILFYARKGIPWFSNSLEKWKAQFEDKFNTSPKSVFDSQDFDKTDPSPVTYVEPLCCRVPDEEPEVRIQSSSTPLTYSRGVGAQNQNQNQNSQSSWDVGPAKQKLNPVNYSCDVGVEKQKQNPVNNSWDVRVEKQKQNPVNCSWDVGVEKQNQKQKDESRRISFGKQFVASIKKVSSAVAAVPYKIPVDHLKIPEKPSTALASAVSSVVRKGEQIEERKEAAKYISSSSMPIGRRQMLLAAMNASSSSQSPSQKRSKQSSSTTMPTSNKRSSSVEQNSSRKRVKISCP